jgi:hypothetical protein
MARMEKQRDKAAKRMERKLNRGLPEADPDAAEPDEFGGPLDETGHPDDVGSPESASSSETTVPKPTAAPKPQE